MSKVYKFVESQQAGPSQKTPTKTDWTLCCLCQEITPEKTQCPAESKRTDVTVGQGYSTLSASLVRFDELKAMPMPIDLKRFDDGNGIEAAMLEHSAKWHKSCHAKFTKSKLERAEKRHSEKTCSGSSKKFTRKTAQQKGTKDVCFFCEKDDTGGTLHEAATFGLNQKVVKCATVLQDQRLLAKISAGDLIAQEAKYHLHCLVSIYNKAAAEETRKDKGDTTDKMIKGIALAELLTYIDEARMDEDVAPVFKLADLVKMYSVRLQQLGVEQDTRPHSTDLKNRILAHFPDLKAHKEGRDILLAFDRDLGGALRKLCKDDFDDEAMCLARAAKIVRRDMLQLHATFTGSFDESCQVNSVPQSLLSIVAMILDGPDIQSQSQSVSGTHQASLSIAQLLQYNSSARRRTGSAGIRHNKARETPLPIYVGLTVHARTRKRDLVETLFDLGLSISYDRVMAISTAMGNVVCEQYHREQVVCPPNLRQGLFTTAALDNIDHNPSSMTATDSFHGTGISLFQYPTHHKPGTDRSEHHILEEAEPTKTLAQLPESYTNVRPLQLVRKDAPLPKVECPIKSDGQATDKALQEEIG